MVEIGGQPILWHIMKIYSSYGINEFIICCGYKGYTIKEYFANYFMRMSDVTFDLKLNQINIHKGYAEPWLVTLVDTGEQTMTGGRLKRVKEHIGNETFCLTYGDGVSNVNIRQLIEFHKQKGTLATLTAVQQPGRFGAISLGKDQTIINSFNEKPTGDGAWINGGYFVVEPQAIDFVADDSTVWEKEPMQKLAHLEQLSAFKHDGFWQPMDTLRDKTYLEKLWETGEAPWKIW